MRPNMPIIHDPKDFLSGSYSPAYEEAVQGKPQKSRIKDFWQSLRRVFPVVDAQDPRPEWFTCRVRDFSMFPAGAHEQDGPYSGERFKQEVLEPALAFEKTPIVVDLKGTLGYGSSWLKAAFEGLPGKRLRFITSDPSLEIEIRGYLQ
jgi:hypothetical protein